MKALILAFTVLLAAFVPAHSAERIHSFASDITIARDSSLTVAETISIGVEGINIRRGIIREFPTTYRDARGDTVTVGFDVLSVLRNGNEEPYRLDRVANGVEVRIGDAQVLLPRGIHTYVITYRTTFQLGQFPEGDQLYFNVTGNGWRFPIETASAVVHLPPGARSTRLKAYTGRQGSRESDATISETMPGTVEARSTTPLRSFEGLTIVVEWPTGFVDKPGPGALLWRWLVDNLSALYGLLSLAATGGFLLWAWNRWGRDPPHGTIIPLFTPPDNVEPAEARFIFRTSFDHKCFAAAVVDMAVKGAIKIEEPSDLSTGAITLRRTGRGEEALSPAEQDACNILFSSSDEVQLHHENCSRIARASACIEASLTRRYADKLVRQNTGPIVAAAVILLVSSVPYLALTDASGLAPFVGGAAIAIGVGLIALFTWLMKAPTVAGQAMRDRIEGFRMYLATAEKERWEVLHPPEMTPQLFEKYLPFALALDVEHTWSQTFEREMRTRAQSLGGDTQTGGPSSAYTYEPDWYSGRNFREDIAGAMSGAISNSLSRAISSSSTAPGQSSGFDYGGSSGGGSGSSGGGSSGGGGGGGGGRGW